MSTVPRWKKFISAVSRCFVVPNKRAGVWAAKNAGLLTGSHDTESDHQHDNHGQENRNALALILNALAEREAQRHRDQQQQQRHLKQVGQRIGVFKRMCRVGAHDTAAVGTGLLGSDLAGLGIPGKDALQHQNGEQENQSHQVECKSAEQIFLPLHVFICVDVEQFIDSIFTRTQDPG